MYVMQIYQLHYATRVVPFFTKIFLFVLFIPLYPSWKIITVIHHAIVIKITAKYWAHTASWQTHTQIYTHSKTTECWVMRNDSIIDKIMVLKYFIELISVMLLGKLFRFLTTFGKNFVGEMTEIIKRY